MIWVFASKDNNFEANSGCKMYVLIQLQVVNVLGKPFKITITIDRDQAWQVKTRCETTDCFILSIDDDIFVPSFHVFTAVIRFLISIAIDRDQD